MIALIPSFSRGLDAHVFSSFFFSSRRRHTRSLRDWSSDVCSSDLRTVLWRIAGKLPAELFEREFAILRRNAEKSFREEGWRGAINFRRSVAVRYRGQGYELNVPYSNTLAEDFRREHQRRYGYSYDRELELVTLRLRAKIRTSQAKISPRSARKAQAAQKQK